MNHTTGTFIKAKNMAMGSINGLMGMNTKASFWKTNVKGWAFTIGMREDFIEGNGQEIE